MSRTDVHTLVGEVEGSGEFLALREAGTGEAPYLAHVFCFARQESAPVEIGYYSPEHDHLVVFQMDPVRARAPEDAFKEEGAIAPLDLAQVGVGLAQARELAARHAQERYPAHPVQQEICILQQGDGPVWSLTLVTATLRLIILRLSARDGEVLSDEMRSIMDLGQD